MQQGCDVYFADKAQPASFPNGSQKFEVMQQGSLEVLVNNIITTPIDPEQENSRPHSGSNKLPFTVYTIAFVQFCTCFTLYGFSGVFQNYLQNPLPIQGLGSGAPSSINDSEPAGALGRGEAVAVGLQNVFWCLVFFFPILGAVISDSKWGRYKAITIFSLLSLMGSLIITVTSVPYLLKRSAGFPGWIIGSVVLALGTGAINSNIAPFLVDQCQPVSSKNSSGSPRRYTSEAEVNIQRVYAINYWCINLGSLAAIATTQLERRVGFWAAFLLPSIVSLLAPLTLILARKQYRKVRPSDTVLTDVLKIIKFALAKRCIYLLNYLRGIFRRGRATQPSVPSVGNNPELIFTRKAKSQWSEGDEALINQLQQMSKACFVLLFFPIYLVAFNQITTNLVSMAATMSTHGLPNDLLQNFGPITLLVALPIMNMVIYPFLCRHSLTPRPIMRMWLGFTLGSCAMVYNAILQHFVYSTNPCGKFASSCVGFPSSISVWAQIPGYVLMALSEIFTYLTGMEYAYSKAPAEMKSVVTGIFYLMSSIGSAVNASLAPVSVDPDLVWNYTGIAVATFVLGNVFYLCFRHLDREGYA